MIFGIDLIPRDNKFLSLLNQTCELANRSVHLLRELTLEENQEHIFKLGREIEIAKNKAKDTTYEITEMLCRTLMTPFDHEDIHRLSRGLYKILKICKKAEERIIAFKLRSFQNDFFKLTQNMVEASDILKDIVKNLNNIKNTKPIHEKCGLIHNIESNTDVVLNQLTIDLYNQENDVKKIIIRREVYNLMENIVDRHRDVANVILEIVLKHS
jgi:uncharacterized protein Yka (UPF0111/DUF47 family)